VDPRCDDRFTDFSKYSDPFHARDALNALATVATARVNLVGREVNRRAGLIVSAPMRRRPFRFGSWILVTSLIVGGSLAGCSDSERASTSSTESTTTTTTIPARTTLAAPCAVVDPAMALALVTKETPCKPLASDTADTLLAVYDDRIITRGVIAPAVTVYVLSGLLADGLDNATAVSTGYDDDAVITPLVVGEGGFIARGPKSKYDVNATTTTIKGAKATTTTTTTTVADDTNIDSADPGTTPGTTIPAGTPIKEFAHVGVVIDQAWVVVTLWYYDTTPKDAVATDETLTALATKIAANLASPANRGKVFSPTSTSSTSTVIPTTVTPTTTPTTSVP